MKSRLTILAVLLAVPQIVHSYGTLQETMSDEKQPPVPIEINGEQAEFEQSDEDRLPEPYHPEPVPADEIIKFDGMYNCRFIDDHGLEWSNWQDLSQQGGICIEPAF